MGEHGMASIHRARLAEGIARGVGNQWPLPLIWLLDPVVRPYSAATPEL